MGELPNNQPPKASRTGANLLVEGRFLGTYNLWSGKCISSPLIG